MLLVDISAIFAVSLMVFKGISHIIITGRDIFKLFNFHSHSQKKIAKVYTKLNG